MQYIGLANKTRQIQEKNKQVMYSNCCNYGAIKIPPYKQPPQFFFELIYKKEDRLPKHILPKNKTI
jgi:hypothetical protein